jgi:phytoene/squalene synthetase
MPRTDPKTRPERLWQRLEGLLTAPPEGRSQEVVERAALRARTPWLLWRAAGVQRPAVRELAGGFAWLALLEGARKHPDPSERGRRRALLARALQAAGAEPSSALARALGASLGPARFERGWLSDALAAAAEEETIGTYATRGELSAHALRRSGRGLRALLRALDRASERTEREADAAEAARVLTLDLCALPTELERGQLYLPFDLMQAAGVLPADCLAPDLSEPLAALIADQIGWIRGLLTKAQPLPRDLGRIRGLPLHLGLTRTRMRLRRLQRRGFPRRRAERKSEPEGSAP